MTGFFLGLQPASGAVIVRRMMLALWELAR